jgi:hypothetical protein
LGVSDRHLPVGTPAAIFGASATAPKAASLEKGGRRPTPGVFSSQVESADAPENTAKQESGVPVLIQSKPNAL